MTKPNQGHKSQNINQTSRGRGATSRRFRNSPTQASGNNKKPIIVVKGHEMVGYYTSTTGSYTLLANQEINPKNPVLFPWLCHITECYEKYRFTSLYFKVTSATAAIESGNYVVAVDLDPYDIAPTEMRQMLMLNQHSVSKVDRDATLIIPANLMQDFRFCDKHLGNDSRLIELGRFFLAHGGVSKVNLTIEVVYTIQLMNPTIPEASTYEASLDYLSNVSGDPIMNVVEDVCAADPESAEFVTYGTDLNGRQFTIEAPPGKTELDFDVYFNADSTATLDGCSTATVRNLTNWLPMPEENGQTCSILGNAPGGITHTTVDHPEGWATWYPTWNSVVDVALNTAAGAKPAGYQHFKYVLVNALQQSVKYVFREALNTAMSGIAIYGAAFFKYANSMATPIRPLPSTIAHRNKLVLAYSPPPPLEGTRSQLPSDAVGSNSKPDPAYALKAPPDVKKNDPPGYGPNATVFTQYRR